MNNAPSSLENVGNSPPTINNNYMVDYINIQYGFDNNNGSNTKIPEIDGFFLNLLKFLKLLLNNFESGFDYLSSEFSDLFNTLIITDFKKNYYDNYNTTNYNLLNDIGPPIYNRNEFLKNN